MAFDTLLSGINHQLYISSSQVLVGSQGICTTVIIHNSDINMAETRLIKYGNLEKGDEYFAH